MAAPSYVYNESLRKRDEATITKGFEVLMGSKVISKISQLPKVGQTINSGSPRKRTRYLDTSDEFKIEPPKAGVGATDEDAEQEGDVFTTEPKGDLKVDTLPEGEGQPSGEEENADDKVVDLRRPE